MILTIREVLMIQGRLHTQSIPMSITGIIQVRNEEYGGHMCHSHIAQHTCMYMIVYRTHTCLYMHYAYLQTATLIDAKRSAVQVAAERVQSLSKAITDTHILEHALATLSTLASSLKANIPMQCNENSNQPTSFSTVDNFAPAQKNEVQLCFKRTTNSAGRKQKMVPLV